MTVIVGCACLSQAGSAWPRIERFFLSASEVEKGIAGMKVQVNGRMGESAAPPLSSYDASVMRMMPPFLSV